MSGARPKASVAAPSFPGLDPAVTQAALSTGIPADQLAEMARVASAGRPRMDDLPKTTARLKDPLSESEEEVLEAVDPAGGTGLSLIHI